MKTITIDRAKWWNGARATQVRDANPQGCYFVSALLVPRESTGLSQDYYCCMGLLAKQCGFDDDELYGNNVLVDLPRMPDDVPEFWFLAEPYLGISPRNTEGPEEEIALHLQQILEDIYTINDAENLSAEDRELALGHLGEMLGFELNFEGDPGYGN